MDDQMPALTLKVEAATIKVDDEHEPLTEVTAIMPSIKLEEEEFSGNALSVRSRLVAYSSSSPPPLMDDFPTSVESSGAAMQLNILLPLRDQLELSTYEYAALEERYCKLLGQHYKLKKLTTAYNDIIHGSPTHDNPNIGLEQLRTEAGDIGLRAKALELNVLGPIIRDAGGLQAVMFLTRSAQALIEQAGSPKNIQDIVQGTTAITRRVHELGGLQGLDQLVANSKLLLVEQQALNELRRSVDSPKGLRAKAIKYDRLQQAFTNIEGGPGGGGTQASVPAASSFRKKKKRAGFKKDSAVDQFPIKVPPFTSVKKQMATSPTLAGGSIASSELGVMNPARAQLLITEPDRLDPDRHLYEPNVKPPVRNLSTNVDNANNVPLGRCRTDRPSEGPHDLDVTGKRKCEAEPQVVATKRSRVNVGRASARVQATIAASSTDPTNVFHPYPQPVLGQSLVNYSNQDNEPLRSTVYHERNHEQRVDSVRGQVSKLIERRGKLEETADTTLSMSRVDRSSIESLLDPVEPIRRQVVKTETPSDYSRAICATVVPSTRTGKEANTQVLVGGYPIALWVGSSSPGIYSSTDLIKDDKIPYALAMFFFTEMKKYINDANAKVWDAMVPNGDTCILRYLVDGHRPSILPSILPQERRACRACSSTWVRHHRPCVFLQDVDDVRMLVFMPLRDALRRGVAWTEKRYWVMDI